MNLKFRIANKDDQGQLIALIGKYHAFESIQSTVEQRARAVLPLLDTDNDYGFILIAESNREIVGYIAICYGYTIEFRGRDAFIDEFYIQDIVRGKGIGSKLIQLAKEQARNNAIRVLHLEVAVDNERAKKLYKEHGFVKREHFHLMSSELKC